MQTLRNWSWVTSAASAVAINTQEDGNSRGWERTACLVYGGLTEAKWLRTHVILVANVTNISEKQRYGTVVPGLICPPP